MSRNAIRLHNLKTLVAEFGTITALAEASGISEKYLSQLVNESRLKSGAKRKIGDQSVEKLEAGCRLPNGWMDTDRREGEAPSSPPLNPAEIELLKQFREGSPAKRRAMLAVARL